MDTLDLNHYPQAESYAAFWVRLTFLHVLGGQYHRFVWEPTGNDPSSLHQYALREGIDELPRGLTYLLLGERAFPRGQVIRNGLLADFLIDAPDIIPIPISAENLVATLLNESSGGDPNRGLETSLIGIRVSSQTIPVSLEITKSITGVRTSCSLGPYNQEGLEVLSLFPTASGRVMEVASDSGLVHYRFSGGS